MSENIMRELAEARDACEATRRGELALRERVERMRFYDPATVVAHKLSAYIHDVAKSRLERAQIAALAAACSCAGCSAERNAVRMQERSIRVRCVKTSRARAPLPVARQEVNDTPQRS